MTIISIIAAIGKKRELGKDNKLLWHIPEDLKRFKLLTQGHPVIMGRKTYQSIGRPLPDRINIIISRDKNFEANNCFVFHSLIDAISFAKNKDKKEIFIIGGGEIYQQAMPLADKLYLTIVEGDYGADTFFPDYKDFKKVIFEKKVKSKKYNYIFLELEKK